MTCMIWSTDTPVKGLRGHEGPNVMRFNLDQVQVLVGLLVYNKVEWFVSTKKRE